MTQIPWMPDVPILRHLTWREVHMFELGIWPGVAIALAILDNELAVALGVVSVVRRKMHADDQREDTDDLVRGYVRDAWYIAIGAVFGLYIGFSLWGLGQVQSL